MLAFIGNIKYVYSIKFLVLLIITANSNTFEMTGRHQLKVSIEIAFEVTMSSG